MEKRFEELNQYDENTRIREEKKLCREIEEEAEKLYQNEDFAASLDLYDRMIHLASDAYVLENPQSLKRAVEMLSRDVEQHIEESNVDEKTLSKAGRAKDLMTMFQQKFEPDENGEYYVELADDSFQKEYRMKAYEQLGTVYHMMEMMEHADYMSDVFHASVNPEYIYVTGLYFEKLLEQDDSLMEEYGAIVVDAYETYLATIDPFAPDIDKIRHAHGILDYYYGFGYGVERNLAKSMLHEQANKSIGKTLGRKKAAKMADLMNAITGYK